MRIAEELENEKKEKRKQKYYTRKTKLAGVAKRKLYFFEMPYQI